MWNWKSVDCSTLSPHLVPTDRSVGKLVDIIIFLMHCHRERILCLWWQLDCDRNDVADAGNDDDADDCVDDRWRVQHSCGRPPASEAAPGPHRTPVSLINCYLTIHGIHCTIETTVHTSSQCTIETIAMHCLRMLFTWSYCPLQLKMQWNTNTAYSIIQSKQPQDTYMHLHMTVCMNMIIRHHDHNHYNTHQYCQDLQKAPRPPF